MAGDFSKEERLLRNIESILTRQGGREDKHPLQTSMMDLLINEFFKLPREKLDTIYKLLDNLSNAGWDVTLHKEQHSVLAEYANQSIENLKKIPNAEYANPAGAIDTYINEYRRLMYLLLNIDNLNNMVMSLCNNYKIATKKLLGENGGETLNNLSQLRHFTHVI